MRKFGHGCKIGEGQRADALFWHFCDQEERAARIDAELVLKTFIDRQEDAEWAKHRDRVVEYFVREYPGRRPKTWWKRETPRLSAEACAQLHDGLACQGIPEPRRMITPGLKVVHMGFDCCCGMPYRIRVRDSQSVTRDWFSGGKSKSSADSQEESQGQGPQFEAQAQYLRRHNLLLPGEAERCDFSPEGYANAQSFIPPWIK